MGGDTDQTHQDEADGRRVGGWKGGRLTPTAERLGS